MEHEIVTLTCKCGVKLKIDVTICPGYSDSEMVNCPECKEDIGTIRADMGYEIIEIIKPE